MTPSLPDIWTAAAVLLGFELTAFSWRVARESQVGDGGDVTWLPWCDRILLLALVATGNIFVIPVFVGDAGLVAEWLLALAALLLVGYPFALAGHYEMYAVGKRSMTHFPHQERMAIGLVVAVVLVYALTSQVNADD